MNYHHIYHAGSFSDVFKHAVLVAVIEKLLEKDKGFCYIDTHAGEGIYDLRRGEVARNPEYKQGIQRVLQSKTIPKILQSYAKVVSSFQTGSDLIFYPGSPLIAHAFARPQDDLILNEFHPDHARALKILFKGHYNVHCHHRDAYEFLPAVLPPTIRRGVVLIDPPYENDQEYFQILQALKLAYEKFPLGIYLIWYPIKGTAHFEFLRRAQKLPFKEQLITEWMAPTNSQDPHETRGTGMLVINPPFQFEGKMTALQQACNQILT